jgi:predicted ribosome quality control (RQC) complex YloA/Tae2 family protein
MAISVNKHDCGPNKFFTRQSLLLRVGCIFRRNTFCVPLDNLQKELYFFWINRKKSNISVEQDRQKVAADSVSDSIAMLKKQIAELDKEIEELEKAGAREKPPADLIEKLHDYNDMKDAGQALLGCLAQLEGTTTKQMYRKFGLNMDD